jgi:hypothetical protein
MNTEEATMLRRLVDYLFFCTHSNTGMPITRRMVERGPLRTYVVCMDCGQEIDYDLERMRLKKSERAA